MSDSTYAEQRAININKLEGQYNQELDSYIQNYENYLKNKSKLINDSPELAAKDKEQILKANDKLLEIIRNLYENIKNADNDYTETVDKNTIGRTIIVKNKKILEKQRGLLIEDKDTLYTQEVKLNHLETLYRGKYKTYTGVLITDIIIAVLLVLMLILSF